MSGLINKMKEALHSSQDTPSDERTGKLSLTAEERERLEKAGYGPSHHAEKRHLGATEDITLSGQGLPPSAYLDQHTTESSAVPGAFPGTPGENTNLGQHQDQHHQHHQHQHHQHHPDQHQQHKDGRQYVAPSGSHVGSAAAAQQTEQQHGLTGLTGHQTTGQNVTGQHTTSNIKDAAEAHSTSHPTHTGSTGTEVASAAAVGAGAGAFAAHENSSGPNKLHKKSDPRGHGHGQDHVAFNEPPTHESIHDSQRSTTHTGGDTTTATHHSIGGTHHNTPGDVYEQQASRKYDSHDPNATTNYSYPTSSTTPSSTTATTAAAMGAGGLAASQLPERKYHNESGLGEAQHVSSASPPRGVGVYNTVTGAGSHDEPTHTHGSSTTGSTLLDKSPSKAEYGQTTGTHAIPREGGNSAISSGQGNTTTSSHAPLPATLTAGGLGSMKSTDHSNPGATYSTGTATNYGTTTPSQTQTSGATNPSTMNPSTTKSSAVNPSGMTAGGQEHYGPGHTGSKVLHTCTKCGEDNDITHYFKKETIYRLSQQ